jgi:glycosyltransferase involved in cell wall biosynthesis
MVISMLPPVDLVDELEQADVTVATLNMTPIPNPLAIFRLAGLLQRHRTVVLHSHMAKANFLGRIAGRVARVPVQISTAHNTVEGGRWVELAYRLTDRLADVTTNVSRRAVERYIAIKAASPSRIRLMYNGLDTSVFVKDAESRERYRSELGLSGRFCWLAVGRLAPGKDYPNMIRAFRRVLDQMPDVRLLVVGKGPLVDEVQQQIQDAELEGHVSLLGERKDVPNLMNAADAHVMSSAWEGAPMVLLEASASGLPVVATDVGGNAELIRDGETGIIVPPGDHEALADGMLRLLRMTEEQRAEMGRTGREFVEREFSLPIVLDRWEALYRSLIKRKTG